MRDFKVGDEVVCVSGEGSTRLSKGMTYTVSWVGELFIKVEGLSGEWVLGRFKLKEEDKQVNTQDIKVGDWVVHKNSEFWLGKRPKQVLKVEKDHNSVWLHFDNGFLANSFNFRKVEKGEQRNPHGDLMKAWAEGFTVEFWATDTEAWEVVETPIWCSSAKYRIQPAEPEDTENQRKIREIEEEQRNLADKQIALSEEMRVLREEL